MRLPSFPKVRGGTGTSTAHRRPIVSIAVVSAALMLSPQSCAPLDEGAATLAPITLTAASTSAMTANWQVIKNARSYEVVYAGTGLLRPVTLTGLTVRTTTITGLTPGGHYEARVRAVTKRGRTPWSAAAQVDLPTGVVPAAAPVAVTVPTTQPPTPTTAAPPPPTTARPTTTAAPTTTATPTTTSAAPTTTAAGSTTTTAAPAPTTTAAAGTFPYAIPASMPGTSAFGVNPATNVIQRPSGDGTGNFRVTCGYSHMNYDDAIVFPGQPGRAHMHTYFGNTGSNASSTPASLLSSGNSTCGGTANRSSYWVPSVINAANQPVVPIWNMVYYKSGYQGVAPSQVSPTLPNGLKMIAGTASSSSAQTAPVRWACANAGGAYTPEQYSIPSCQPGDTLKMDIQFPQCWDGINLDSPDHKSHMAYGDWGVGCPANHPVAIPAISFNIDFPVGAGGTTGWKLASDSYPGAGTSAPGGYSLHADIIIAWDPTVSALWLNNCTRQNADCHVGLLSDTQQLG